MMITLKNSADARIGDKVTIGIDRQVQRAAYLLAYIAPLASFVAGSLCGHVIGNYFSIPQLDAAVGFAALVVTSVFSFRRLAKLDRSSLMTIKNVIRENIFDADVKTDEEQRYECCPANLLG
jgi:positive regulator of sigma E activity